MVRLQPQGEIEMTVRARKFLAFVLLAPDQEMVGCRGRQQCLCRASLLFGPRAITRSGQTVGPTLVIGPSQWSQPGRRIQMSKRLSRVDPSPQQG